MDSSEGQGPYRWTAPPGPSSARRDTWPRGTEEAGVKADLARRKAPQVCRALAMRWSPFIVGEENPHELIQYALSPEGAEGRGPYRCPSNSL